MSYNSMVTTRLNFGLIMIHTSKIKVAAQNKYFDLKPARVPVG